LATTTDRREVRAQAKWVRTSARKARLVAEHIRGRPVAEARAVLAFTPRAAAREMEKVLRSAVANAEANHGMHGDDLVVHAAYVDEGPTLKRWRARARGRVARIRKRTCHITVLLVEVDKPARSRRGGAEAEKKSRRPSVPRRTKTEAAAESKAVEPKAEVEAEAPAAEAAAPAEEKPKRRAPVRRKKTEEKES
jgi:large subunit ribosomal protein L22